MPSARASGFQEPRSNARVTRTESLKSERSDKRVSFNNDVGVKHIPRGLKPSPQLAGAWPGDEWAACSLVKREPTNLSAQELEKQAEDLVKLLENVACSTEPTPAIHPAYTTRSLDRPSRQKNKQNPNNKVLVNNIRNNSPGAVSNKTNTGSENYEKNRALPTSRTTNPIKGHNNKGDTKSNGPLDLIPNGQQYFSFHGSIDSLTDSDFEPTHYKQQSQRHKSVPDLSKTVYYDNAAAKSYKYAPLLATVNDRVIGGKTIDDYGKGIPDNHLKRPNRRGNYKSVDNIISNQKSETDKLLQGYKSLGNIPSALSIKGERVIMAQGNPYQPKVSNIIRKLNEEAEDQRRYGIVVNAAIDNNSRGLSEPDPFHTHNNNKPFSYTGFTPLASVQVVRRLSPPRDMRASPVRDLHVKTSPTREIRILRETMSPSRNSPVRDIQGYAQVGKFDRSSSLSSGSRDTDKNYQNVHREPEYSAKIIITDDSKPYANGFNVHNNVNKTQYLDDDVTYENYSSPSSNIRKLLHDKGIVSEDILDSDELDGYNKSLSYNNINMSSIGVQTEGLPKIPSRIRKSHKSPAPMPPGYKGHIREYGQIQDTKEGSENNLTSATLVRQVNHGFGRTDRSPSPPPRVSPARQQRRNVVPLLSDTSDSEAEIRKRNYDPMAKVRDQIMLTEKLQEVDEEDEDRRERHLHGMYANRLLPYKPTQGTLDNVDRRNMQVDENGHKSMIVSHQSQSNFSSRMSNHRSRRSETVTERIHPIVVTKPLKPPREKNIAIKDKRMSSLHNPKLPEITNTLERNKNNLEKANKEARERESNEKKKKRIKIKFFFDPRPQDDANVDPLARFTEFRGSSDENYSPPEPYSKHNKLTSKDSFRSHSMDSQRDSSRERVMQPRIPRHESTESRSSIANYAKSSDRRYTRDSSNENRKETAYRQSSRDSNESQQYRQNISDRDDHSSRTKIKPGIFGNRNKSVEKSGPIYHENSIDSQPGTEEEEKQQKILRQRKKFLSHLMSDGRGVAKANQTSSVTQNGLATTRTRTPNMHEQAKGQTSLKMTSRQKKKRAWPWGFLGLRGGGRATPSHGYLQGGSSRASSRASSRGIAPRPQRPSVRASKIHRDGSDSKLWFSRDRKIGAEKTNLNWESATLNRADLKSRQESKENISRTFNTSQRPPVGRKFSNESSASNTSIGGPPISPRVARTTSFKQRYFGDSDAEIGRKNVPVGDYRSLPNRAAARRASMARQAARGPRRTSQNVVGSAGSSLQSSESEVDSQGGSHASKASTGSNRSVYLHATTVADIPVRRHGEIPMDSQLNRQSKKVSRSFSLLAPWKPRHYREQYEVDYDNQEARPEPTKGALPPRPPRKFVDNSIDSKKVTRSQSMYKDSRLAGWLKRRKNKDVKGI